MRKKKIWSQNVLKSYLKKSRICPISGQSDPFWVQIRYVCYRTGYFYNYTYPLAASLLAANSRSYVMIKIGMTCLIIGRPKTKTLLKETWRCADRQWSCGCKLLLQQLQPGNNDILTLDMQNTWQRDTKTPGCTARQVRGWGAKMRCTTINTWNIQLYGIL